MSREAFLLEALRVQIRFGNSECPLALSGALSVAAAWEQRAGWGKAGPRWGHDLR